MCIKKWEFEFERSPANTMGLIPVNFDEAERAVNQTDARFGREHHFMLFEAACTRVRLLGGSCYTGNAAAVVLVRL